MRCRKNEFRQKTATHARTLTVTITEFLYRYYFVFLLSKLGVFKGYHNRINNYAEVEKRLSQNIGAVTRPAIVGAGCHAH